LSSNVPAWDDSEPNAPEDPALALAMDETNAEANDSNFESEEPFLADEIREEARICDSSDWGAWELTEPELPLEATEAATAEAIAEAADACTPERVRADSMWLDTWELPEPVAMADWMADTSADEA